MQRFAFIFILSIILLSLVALALKEERPPIKVGILHSLTGKMAASEKPIVKTTLLAIEQINAKGGLLGRMLEPVVVDGKSDPLVFAREAKRLIKEEHVSILFGCGTSASRKAVKAIVETYNHLLFYPLQYEGLEQSPNIIYLGAIPNQQIIPATAWAIENAGPRLYLVGSDDILSHVAHWMIGQQAPLLHGKVVGAHYLPLANTHMHQILDEITALKPDIILNTTSGDTNIAFFQGLHRAGFTATSMPVLSFNMSEADLAHLPNMALGHYAAWSYAQSLDTAENLNFIEAYQTRFGADKVISEAMAAAWVGVQLWAKAVTIAQSDNPATVRQTVTQQSIQAPEGLISIDAKTQHTWKHLRIGQVQRKGHFSTLWSSDEPIRPAPYPSFIAMNEAKLFLDTLYDKWHQHWKTPDSRQGGKL